MTAQTMQNKERRLMAHDFIRCQSSSFNNLSINSFVEYTLTNDCFFKCGSLDQIAALIDNARARYGESFGSSGKESIAPARKELYSEDLKNLINALASKSLSPNSCSDSFDLDRQSALCLLSSDNANSVVKKSALSDENRYDATDLGFIIENSILLSRTNIIFYFECSLLFSGERWNSSLALISGESSLSSLLKDPFFAFLPNSTDHFISSCSSLESSLLRTSSNSVFFSRFSLATSDQLTQDNLPILAFSSSSTANVTLAIYTSPLLFNSSNFSSSSTFLIIPLLTTSAQFISGCDFLNLANNSFGTDTVIFGIFVLQSIYFNTSKYVIIFKPFDFN